MPVAIRLRRDSLIAAIEHKTRLAGGPWCPPDWVTDDEAEATPPPEPGDAWRIGWYMQEGEATEDFIRTYRRRYGDASIPPESNVPLAGFAICCIKCGEVHHWTSANNCSTRKQLPPWKDQAGVEHPGGGYTCQHIEDRTSCWTWTLDADGRPLTARASLLCHICGYHGFLNADGNSPGILSDQC